MRTVDLLERRRQGWHELDSMCDKYRNFSSLKKPTAAEVTRFAALYRAACTDLAMAENLKLPPTTLDYWHRLVGRAHSHLYRSHRLPTSLWWTYVFETMPKAVFNDPCVKITGVIFFGLFSLAALLSWAEGTFPKFGETILGKEQIQQLEGSFAKPLSGNIDQYASMAAFYIQHNTSIGLECFALGPLLIPSLFKLAYNAIVLGASFGYMARPEIAAGDTFFEFVTAHGVFELTAISLSSAAGLRLGIGWIVTNGLSRLDAFRVSAKKALPIILVAVALFILAAFTEGFISPSPLPYAVKALFAIVSASLLMFYFVILGYPSDLESNSEESVI